MHEASALKRVLIASAVTAGLVALCVLLYQRAFRDVDDEPEWIVSSYSGLVMVSRDGESWVPAVLKVRLHGDDRIRTARDGEATLVHDASHVTVRSDTMITVSQLSLRRAEFQVSSGMVYVESRGVRVRVTASSGQVAETLDAGFGMSVQPDGLALIQVKRGEVEFTSGGHSERVLAGEESQARAGRAPSRPVEIPQALFTEIQFPDAKTFSSRLARFEGRVAPGARLLIGGEPVATDEEGRFSAMVPLAEGMNQITLTARDSLGREEVRRSPPIRVDTLPPQLGNLQFGERGKPRGEERKER